MAGKTQVCRGIYNLVPCASGDTAVRTTFKPPIAKDIKHAQTRFDRLKKRDTEVEESRRAAELHADGGYRRANTVTLLTSPLVEPCNVPFTSSAASAPNLAPNEHYASSARPTAGVCLLTSPPSVAAALPAPVPPDLFIRGVGVVPDLIVSGPCAVCRGTETIAHDNLARDGGTPLGGQAQTSDQEALFTAGAHGPATHSPPPAAYLLSGHAEAGHVIVNSVLPGQDDTPKVRHHKKRGGRRFVRPLGKTFVAAPPTHPLLLAGKPIACSLEMVEVLNQQQPLFSLGVLERAAKLMGILVRLETCPAEDGASWLRLDGIGRIPVSRIGGLVLIGYRMVTPGRILLGCRSEHSALVDTGAQVCLFSRTSQLVSLSRSAYTGPPLRGADNAP